MNLCPVLPEHPRIIYRIPGALTAALHGPESLRVFIFMKSTVAFGVREPVQKHDQAFKFHIFYKNAMDIRLLEFCPRTCP